MPAQLSDAVTWPTTAGLQRLTDGAIWLAGLSLAFVASAESLLTATAVDFMQRHAPRTRYDRELGAQGIGNLLCGLLGVLPITGVIVRSSANVLAGARSRLSSFLHGFWLLLFVALLPFALSLIPVAGLAAVLVYTGVKLTKLQYAKILWRQDRAEAAVYAATLGTVVMLDLLTGIVVGIVLALTRLLYTFSHLEIKVEERPETARTSTSQADDKIHGVKGAKFEPQRSTHIYLHGAATFLRLPQLAAVFEKLRPNAQVHVHVDELNFVDHACLDLLANWEQQHKSAGGRILIDWESLHGVFQRHAWCDNSQQTDDAKVVVRGKANRG